MNNYEINCETLAIIPIDVNKSRVVEENNEFIVYKRSSNIINDSCKYFGSSYQGRKNGSKNLLGSTHKLPIIIEEINRIIFFPTASPRNEECLWLSLNQIDEYKKENNGSTIIKFTCGKVLKIDVSHLIIDNQVLRATRLEAIYEKRVKNIEKKVKN